MLSGQDKNTIRAVVIVLLAVVIGEGVFGWGIYWTFLFWLIDWDYIFWLGLVCGILIASFNGLSFGWPSLFIVVSLGLASAFTGVKKGVSWRLILLSMVANLIFDKLFGLHWSVWEAMAVFISGLIVFNWDNRGESIKVRYK